MRYFVAFLIYVAVAVWGFHGCMLFIQKQPVKPCTEVCEPR